MLSVANQSLNLAIRKIKVIRTKFNTKITKKENNIFFSSTFAAEKTLFGS